MKKILLVQLLFLSAPNLFSQSIFQQIYRNDSLVFSINYAAMTYDKGFVLAGVVSAYQIFGSGPGDVFILRTDSAGNVLWSRRCDLANDEEVFNVLQTPDTGYLITGFTFGATTASRDGFILKVDDAGNIDWVKRYDHGGATNTFHSIRNAEPNRYILSGRSDGGAGGQYDMYMCLSDTGGNILWGKTYGGSNWDWGWWAEQTSDLGFIMTGESQSFGIGSNDIYLVKTDTAGNKMWSKVYGSTTFEKGLWVKQYGGSYYVAGYTQGFVNGNTNAKTFLMKTDLNGNVMWFKIYPEMDSPGAATLTADGGFLIAGGAYNQPGGFGSFDLYVIKTDSAGNVKWSHHYGGTASEGAGHISEIPGGYLIGGITPGFISPSQMRPYLIKTDTARYSGCNDASSITTVLNASPTVITPADLVSSGSNANIPVVTVSSPVISKHVLCSVISSDHEMIKENENIFQVYPNPATEVINISFEKDKPVKSISVFDPMSRHVISEMNISSETGNISLNCSSLSPGIYFLKVESNDNVLKSARIVIHR